MALNGLIPLQYVRLIFIFGVAAVVTGAVWWIARELAPKKRGALQWRILPPAAASIAVIVLYMGIAASSAFAETQGVVDSVTVIALALLLSVILVRVLSTLIGRWLQVNQEFSKTPEVLTNVVAVAVYAIAFLMILAYFGIDVTPLITTLGIGGLAVGLALQNTLSNFFAGLHLISDKPIRIDDFIELENGTVTGRVEDIGWRSTRIRTLQNTAVVVPNAKLAESTITNDSMPEQATSFWTDVGVAYTEDLDRAENVVVDVATRIQQEEDGAVTDFEPFIRYREFGDSNIIFRVIMRVEEPMEKYRVRHTFIKELHDRFKEEDIEISWPVRKIYRGNQSGERDEELNV